MKSILFVDDEPRILDGLRRMLRPQRQIWEMSFANSGAEALAMMEKTPFDVVVTDMRMPAMDGAQLLEAVREKYPVTIRIVLSGYFEMEAALRAVPVAHQYLAKPCDPEKLREAIERSCALATLLPDGTIRRVVGAVGGLPTLPRTSTLLLEAMQGQDVPLEQIGKIIEQDVGLTAKMLQLVNSAFFGLPQQVESVRMAVSFLGLDTLRQLVLSVEIFRTFRVGGTIGGFTLDGFEKHSQLAARIAAKLPAAQKVTSAAVVAALLHDAGKLVLATRLPREFEQALRTSVEKGVPLFLVEEEQLGTSHAEIGAYLLGLWGLPSVIVNAVWWHHHPSIREDSGPGLDVLAVTHIADALSFELTHEAPGDAPPGSALLLSQEYVAQLGAEVELPSWRALAQQALGQGL